MTVTLRCRKPRGCDIAIGLAIVGCLAVGMTEPASAQASSPSAAPGSAAAVPCSSARSALGVTISSCAFTLAPSPAGNPDYFVNVTIKYSAPAADAAVRFRCTLGNGSTNVAQYGVLRQSGATLRFVSPFVSSSSTLKSVACSVDAA